MAIEAEVLAHSVGPLGRKVQEVVSFSVRCPVFVHYEVLRHRSFSFSVASTRAVPLKRQADSVDRDPFVPFFWGANRSGMQAGGELGEYDKAHCKLLWLKARDAAVDAARRFDDPGLHKQTGGRVLLPFWWMDMVITACWPGLANFFRLRCHEKAQAETRRLAVRMADAFRKSEPQVLEPGWWHLPYVTKEELARLCKIREIDSSPVSSIRHRLQAEVGKLLRLSVARTGRVSFLQHGVDEQRIEKDLKFHDDRLREADYSVFEHQARVPYPGEDISKLQGNLLNFIQYRQTLTPNVYTDFDFAVLDQFAEDLA
jgi:hypothetical protein